LGLERDDLDLLRVALDLVASKRRAYPSPRGLLGLVIGGLLLLVFDRQPKQPDR
jgi:hypothetical protein